MTAKLVLDRGFTVRNERGDVAKLAWLNQESARRFTELKWVLEARRLNMRAANRRYRRLRGMPFHNT